MRPTISLLIAPLCLACLAATSPALADEAAPERPPECATDTDCPEGELCSDVYCLDASLICMTSEDCSVDEICDIGIDHCPSSCGADCPERCTVHNGRCQPTTPDCSADSDCDSESLCQVYYLPTCLADDVACENTMLTACYDFVQFCSTDDNPNEACRSAGDVCNAYGRCVLPEFQEASETIVIDEEKAERIRAQEQEDLGGCGVARRPQGSGSPLAWLGLLGLGFFGVRQRRG